MEKFIYKTIQNFGSRKANIVCNDLTGRVITDKQGNAKPCFVKRKLIGNSFEITAYNAKLKRAIVVFRYMETGQINYIEYLVEFFRFDNQ